jgi:hypothetical protein
MWDNLDDELEYINNENLQNPEHERIELLIDMYPDPYEFDKNNQSADEIDYEIFIKKYKEEKILRMKRASDRLRSLIGPKNNFDINLVFNILEKGISLIPLNNHNEPINEVFFKFRHTLMSKKDSETYFSNKNKIGILCGKVSGGLEVIKITTYDNPLIWEAFSSQLKSFNSDLFNSLIISKSKNGVYYIYYRTSLDTKGRIFAQKNDTDILIKTYGEGDWVNEPITNNFEYISSNKLNDLFFEIPLLKSDERELVLDLCMSFDNEYYINIIKNQIEDDNNRISVINKLKDRKVALLNKMIHLNQSTYELLKKMKDEESPF